LEEQQSLCTYLTLVNNGSYRFHPPPATYCCYVRDGQRTVKGAAGSREGHGSRDWQASAIYIDCHVWLLLIVRSNMISGVSFWDVRCSSGINMWRCKSRAGFNESVPALLPSPYLTHYRPRDLAVNVTCRSTI